MSKLFKLFKFKGWRKRNEKPLNKSLATLVSLCSMHSPSGRETAVLAFIEQRLADLGISYQTDKYGQIFHVSLGQPLLCAHTDQVQKSSPSKSDIRIQDGQISAPGFGLGADDKNGVWLILETLKRRIENKKPIPSFIFSVEEETCSGRARECFENHFADLDTPVPFALVLDRRGAGDIIATDNGYCSQEFETTISEYGKDFGYKPAAGAYSDANGLSRFVNVVNLSVGYHSPHTTEEYTVISELENALAFTLRLLESDAAAALAACKFEEKKALLFDDCDYDYDFSYGWKGGKKKKKVKSSFEEVSLLPSEKRYLYNLLTERLRVLNQRLDEHWMGNVDDDKECEKLEEEVNMIEVIMGELAQ